MPYLTLQISAGGPVVDIKVGVSRPRFQALQVAGQPTPVPIQIRGLVDTGATCTCVHPSVLTALQLVPTGTVPVHTPSTGANPHVANQFDVSLELVHPRLSFTIYAVPVLESQLQGPNQVLIGRDVLAHCLFVYDGKSGIFSLAF